MFLVHGPRCAADPVARLAAEALHAYTNGDPTFAEHVFGDDTVIGRDGPRGSARQ